jgi:hypothetical protein
MTKEFLKEGHLATSHFFAREKIRFEKTTPANRVYLNYRYLKLREAQFSPKWILHLTVSI